MATRFKSLYSKYYAEVNMSYDGVQTTADLCEVIQETHKYHWLIPASVACSSAPDISKCTQTFTVASKTGIVYKWEIGFKALDPPNFTPYLRLIGPTDIYEGQLTPVRWMLFWRFDEDRRWNLYSDMANDKPVFNFPEITLPEFKEPIDGIFTMIKGMTSFQFKSELVLKIKTQPVQAVVNFKTASISQQQQNMEKLLSDTESADLVIICSDREMVLAHKFILKNSQSPVLASMLSSDMREAHTGILHMDDITNPIMKILLHYLYTGSLKSDWCEPDNIVDFIYAAAKLLLTDVLFLLDNLLGTLDLGENLVSVFIMVNKLACLQKAERELRKKVKETVKNLEEIPELKDIFKSSP